MSTDLIKVPIVLPVGHLSFSQITLWLSAKETYRKKYYPDVRPKYSQTIEMAFGNEVTEAMERGEEWTSFIPHYPVFEWDASCMVDDVLVHAYIDNINLESGTVGEQKTGRTPWSQNKVNKHLQMDIYSLLVKIKLGYVDDYCRLIWVKAQKKIKRVPMVDGTFIEAESNEIELVGGPEGEGYIIRPRTIVEAEREACRELINRVAKEISEDYRAMKKLYN